MIASGTSRELRVALFAHGLKPPRISFAGSIEQARAKAQKLLSPA